MKRTALLIAVACVLAGCSREAAPPPKPNFLIVLIDDLGWTDLGVQGSDLYQTPAIDRLAADGVRFTNGYAACTVCSPTRAAMMTGMYPARTHVTDWIRGHQRPHAPLRVPDWTMKLEPRHITIAEALKSAGYKTAHVGKWHLMPAGEPDQEDYAPTRHGFDRNLGGNEYGAPPTYFHPYSRNNRSIGPLPPGGQDGDYLTDRLTSEALKVLEEWQEGPFLMYFAHYGVHTPIEARDEDIARFQPLIQKEMRHRNATYAGMLASVDRSVARLRAKLAELDLAGNTVIIFTSDNGGLDRHGSGDPTENAPLRDGKGSVYEGGVRVPHIVYWPGVTPAGGLSDVPVMSIDYYPTILEIAGVAGDPAHNANVDGVSLVPLLRDPQASLPARPLFWHYPHYHTMGATPYSAVRDADWRLVEFLEDNRVELYNLKDDGSETRDLAAEMPEKVAELRTRLSAWRESVGAQMPSPNPDHDPAKDQPPPLPAKRP